MSNFIKVIRKNRGWTQEELGQRVNTTSQQIGNLESGKRRLTQDWIRKLADALECHPLDITEGPPDTAEEKKRVIFDEMNGLSDTAIAELRNYIQYLKSRPGEK